MVRRILTAILASALVVLGYLAVREPAPTEPEPDRYPYEHVFRVTATLTFDGERIEVNDLIDCRSRYQGPATRAVQLGFAVSRWQLPYPTADGGVIVINVPPNACAAFGDLWAGVEEKVRFPDAWLPFMAWYDNRDVDRAVRGEFYWSERALEDPDGRLKVVEGFRVIYPEQTPEVVQAAAEQADTRAMSHYVQKRAGSALFLWQVPVYLRLPREVWSREPEYRMVPDRAADVEGLSDFLDALPQGEGLMYLGDVINPKTAPEFWYSIDDHLWGRIGGTTGGYHGIPQRDEPHWGMYLSERSWQRAQIEKWRVPFHDNWLSLDYQDGTLVLRDDKPGLAFLFAGLGDWLRETQRPVQFLGKPFVNGPYTNGPYMDDKSLLIFDLETRDLWVRR